MHGTIPQLERDLHDAEQSGGRRRAAGSKPGGLMLSDSVTPDAIATIVARHTGIPVSKIASSKESSRLLRLEDSLRKRVVGQDHALEAVGNCVRLARTRLQAHNRTLGNFLFLGPTVRSAKVDDGHAIVVCPLTINVCVSSSAGCWQDGNRQSSGRVPLRQ